VFNFEVALFSTKDEDVTEIPKISRFSIEEDSLLVQSWLNVSKDVVIKVDQFVRGFWLKITTNYNKYHVDEKEKTFEKLKV